MRNFILGGLLVSSLVACTTSNGGGGGALGHVSATWSLGSVDATGNVTAAACPAGYDTAALHTVAASPDGTYTDSCTTVDSNCFIDLFNCSDGVGISSPLPAQNYVTWVEITDHSGASTWATSKAEFVDITNVDMNFNAGVILLDGGYFKLTWSLMGESSGATLTCSQTAAAKSAGGSVEVISTINGTATALTDKFDCEDHFGYSAPLPSDNYTIVVDALNSSNQALSSNSPTPISKTIGAIPNDIVDLGHVIIPIAGQ